MLQKLIDNCNAILIAMSSGLKQSFFDYNNLETALDDFTLVATDGSLLSIISIDGIKSLIGVASYENNVVQGLENLFNSPMSKTGHIIQSCFHYDPTNSEQLIHNMLSPSYETCTRLDINAKYMLDAQKEVVKGSAADERNYLLLWTTPSVLSKKEAKDSVKDKVEEYKSYQFPINNSGNPFAANMAIYERHKSFVNQTMSELSRIGLETKSEATNKQSRPLTVVEGVREIRRGVDEEYTSKDWSPSLPGDRIMTQRKQHYNAEEWDIMSPKLSQQICSRDAEIIETNVVKIGNYYYAPIYIDIMPKKIQPFNKLFGSLLVNKFMPWRIMYTIEGDGMASINLKHTVSRVLAVTSKSNKLLNRDADNLVHLAESETIVKYRISLCTWSKSLENVKAQVAILSRAVESWGNPQISEITGNPIAGLASSSIGFTTKGVATVNAAPLHDAIMMMPFSRPSNLWDNGAVIFSAIDGKLMPYQPMSSKQATWITLIFAGPGSGKSVLMNMTNIALCLSPGIKRLPRISILDIGWSSKGFIDLMHDALPNHMKHLVIYKKLANTKEFCMNPMDTKVGCRFPISVDLTYLINLVTLLITDSETKKIESGVTDFVRVLIEKTYETYSDSPSYQKTTPYEYTSLTEPNVDSALKKIGVKLNISNQMDTNSLNGFVKPTTWWDVVDILSSNGYWEEAAIANRHAVPTLNDLVGVAYSNEAIQSSYKEFTVNEGENIFSAIRRTMDAALKAYPILSGRTLFNFGSAKLISLNLEDVAKSISNESAKQTAVMYMYAMKLISGDFFVGDDSVNEMPFKFGASLPEDFEKHKKNYIEFHTKRIEEIKEDKKRLSVDEFHRTQSSPSVRNQIMVYMREGRKWGVEVVLASQSIDDFEDTMIEFATTIFVMSADSQNIITKIVEKIGFKDPAEVTSLKNDIRPPSSDGNVFMMKVSNDETSYTQVLRNKMGPVQLWSLSTTVQDVKLRGKVFAEVGSEVGRKLLAVAYPSGSAKSDIERREFMMRSNGAAYHFDVYDELVKEMILRYGNRFNITKKFN